MGKIRVLLALSVVAAHGGMLWQFGLLGGRDAVQAFYVISGFYMSLVLNEKYVGANNSYKLFISNRYLRLAPVYWAVLLCTLGVNVAVLLFSKGQIPGLFNNFISVRTSLPSMACLIFTNIFIVGQDIIMFLGLDPHNGALYLTHNPFQSNPQVYTFLFVPQAWTLGLELSFYMIAPFIVRRGLKLNLLLILASLTFRLIAFNYFHLQKDPWTYRFFPFELIFFLMGYISYRIYTLIKDDRKYHKLGHVILTILIVFTILYSFIPGADIDYTPFTLKQVLYIALLVPGIPFMFNTFRKSRWDNKLGELSYPIYISHILVISLVASKRSHFSHPEIVIVLFTLLLSVLLVRYVSDPIEKYRQDRLTGRKKADSF